MRKNSQGRESLPTRHKTESDRDAWKVRPLDKEDAGLFLDFFEGRAFADNPDWKHCYCTFFFRGGNGGSIAGLPARMRRRDQVAALIAEGRMRGLLAFDAEGRVIGWCNANRKTAFARLAPFSAGDESVLAIVCFVVDPNSRRRGVSQALLNGALSEAAREGYAACEARPSSKARTAAGHYHGTPSLYESAGFELVPGGRGVVRKSLSRGEPRGGLRASH